MLAEDRYPPVVDIVFPKIAIRDPASLDTLTVGVMMRFILLYNTTRAKHVN